MTKRLVAVLTALCLLGSGPGAQPLFAQAARTQGTPGHAVQLGPLNPQAQPGGPLFQGAAPALDLPPGFSVLPSGLVVPASLAPAPAGLQPALVGPAGLPLGAQPEAAPARAEGSAAAEAARALSSDEVSRMAPSDARDGGDRLQALLEGRAARTGPAPVLVPAAALPEGGRRTASAAAASRTRGVSTAAVPEKRAEVREPGRLKRLLLRPMLWAQSVRHYFVDVAADNWREYKRDRIRALAAVAQAQGAAFLGSNDAADLAVSDARGFFGEVQALSVSDGRRFFAEERMIGHMGVRIVGTLSGPEALAVAEANSVFERYFDHPRLDRAGARQAFAGFVETARRLEAGRRSSSLRKQLRKALVAASNLPPEQVAGSFRDSQRSLLSYETFESLSDFQSEVLAEFRKAVEATLGQEELLEPDASKRAVAVVLMGSFASGKARLTSDLDIQVVTADGSSDRVAPFVERLKAAWKLQVNPINAAAFAFPPSLELLTGAHREPFVVISHDAAVERMLGPPAGAFEGRSATVEPTLPRRAERAFWHAAIRAVQWGADLKDKAAAPFKAAETTSNPVDEKSAKRALIGLSAARMLSIAAFILTMVAFAKLGTSQVGDAFADLKALGSVMSIVLGPLTGKMIDRVTLRKSMSFNAVLRIAIGLALPALVYFGGLNFFTLFLFTMVMNWNITSTMIAEDRLVPAITKEKNLRGINALLQIEYFGLSVMLGVFLGWGRIVDSLTAWLGPLPGFSAVFAISAAVHVAVLALYMWAIPNIRPAPKKADKDAKDAPAQPAPADEGLAKKVAVWVALIGAGTGLYFWLDSTIPLVVGTIIGVSRSAAFKVLWKQPIMRASLLFNMLTGFLFYPMNEVIIPFLTKTQTGMFQASLAGAMFFGQLIATSTRVEFPKGWNEGLRAWVAAKTGGWLKLPEGVTLERMGMAAAFTLSGVWLWFYLFPGSLPALGLGLLASATLFVVSGSLTDRGWLKSYGVFMTAGIGLAIASFMPWGSPALLMVGFLLIGLGFGPNKVTLDTGIQKEARKLDPSQVASVMGIKSALTSAALALGFAVTRPVVKLDFPQAFYPVAAAFLVGLVLFWLSPRWLGDVLSSRSFKLPEWLKKRVPGAEALPPGFWVRRLAAAAAAGWFGAQVLAPRPSQAQALSALEAEMRSRGTRVLMVDYDGTLMDKTADNKAVPADDGLLELLAELKRRTGVRVVVVTNHFFTGDHNGMTHLLGDRMAAATRAGVQFVVQSGSRIYEYGAEGEAPAEPAWKETPFDDAERAAKAEPALLDAAREAGLEPGDVQLFHEESRSLLEVRTKQDRVGRLLESLERINREKGLGYIVQLKPFPTMRKDQVPYVQVFKAHKGTGARKAFERLKAAGAVESERQVLILGDDFKKGGNDAYMAKELPGALAVSLGDETDPAQRNVLPWHAAGAAGSREILRALIDSLVGDGASRASAGGPNPL